MSKRILQELDIVLPLFFLLTIFVAQTTCGIDNTREGRQDIDECGINGTNACDVNARCINTQGSFICRCDFGYSGDGTRCRDINECARREINNCDVNAICTNTLGSFACTCNNGYIGDGNVCVAITTAIPTLASSSPSTTANPNDNEYPENAVVYDVNILVVDDVPPQQRSNFYEQIESQLLVRAVNTLPGYHSTQRTVESIINRELSIQFDLIFIAVNTGTTFQFPLRDTVLMRINRTASQLNFIFTVNQSSYRISMEILLDYQGIKRDEINSQCNPSNLCSFLFNAQSSCVEIGSMSLACVCVNVRDGNCENIPLPPIQRFTLRYEIVTTILVNATGQQEVANLFNALQTNLLRPALMTFPDIFLNVRFVSSAQGSLIVTSLAEFNVSDINNLNSFPTSSMIDSSLRTTANNLGSTLRSPHLTEPATFSTNFEVNHQAVNGECSSITPCPTPPPGYTSRCVEIGFSDHVCLCVSNIDGAELDCGIINAGGSSTSSSSTVSRSPPSSLSIGAMVGIAVGGAAVVIIAIVAYCCLKKRKTSKKLSPPQSPNDQRYLSSKEINSTIRRTTIPSEQDVYMEISPEFYGAYLEIDKPEGEMNRTETSLKTVKEKPGADGYELAIDLDEKPELPKNHPTKSLESLQKLPDTKTLASPGDSNPKNLSKLGETEDGYLAPQKLEVENGYLLPMKALPNETEAPSQDLKKSENLSDEECDDILAL